MQDVAFEPVFSAPSLYFHSVPVLKYQQALLKITCIYCTICVCAQVCMHMCEVREQLVRFSSFYPVSPGDQTQGHQPWQQMPSSTEPLY